MPTTTTRDQTADEQRRLQERLRRGRQDSVLMGAGCFGCVSVAAGFAAIPVGLLVTVVAVFLTGDADAVGYVMWLTPPLIGCVVGGVVVYDCWSGREARGYSERLRRDLSAGTIEVVAIDTAKAVACGIADFPLRYAPVFVRTRDDQIVYIEPQGFNALDERTAAGVRPLPAGEEEACWIGSRRTELHFLPHSRLLVHVVANGHIGPELRTFAGMPDDGDDGQPVLGDLRFERQSYGWLVHGTWGQIAAELSEVSGAEA